MDRRPWLGVTGTDMTDEYFRPGFSTTLFYLKLMDWSLKTHKIFILKIVSTLFGNQNVQKLLNFVTLQKRKRKRKKDF